MKPTLLAFEEDRARMPEQIAMGEFEAMLAAERTRLVQRCAQLVGDWDVAEDLAQETLLQAWRVRRSLRDAAGMSSWLVAIARYVCLRYRRQRRKSLTSNSPKVIASEESHDYLEEL